MRRLSAQFFLLCLGGLVGLVPAGQAVPQADGVCTPAESQAGLCWLAHWGYVIEAVTGPNGEFPVLDPAGNSVFSYLITGPGAGGGSCNGAFDISHVAIQLPVGCAKGSLRILDASPAPELLAPGQGDPSCSFGSGDLGHEVLKWDIGLACTTSRLYTLVVEGRVPAAPAAFSFKAGPLCKLGTILGPACPDAVRYCPTLPNSLGETASIGYLGSLSIADNNFFLTGAGLVPGQTGYFFFGTQEAEFPLGNGFGCVAGKIFRMEKMPISLDGKAALHVDFNLPPQDRIPPGLPIHFQLFYRDPAAGGAGFNTSDALIVTFYP